MFGSSYRDLSHPIWTRKVIRTILVTGRPVAIPRMPVGKDAYVGLGVPRAASAWRLQMRIGMMM